MSLIVVNNTGAFKESSALTASLGTALPASPVDGQEFTLTDSTTNSTYTWRFRYNAGSSNTDKWEFIGGAPAYSEVATSETLTNIAYTALATAGPSVAVPRAGVYNVEIGARMRAPNSVSGITYMSFDIGGTGATDTDAISVIQNDATTPRVEPTQSRLLRKTLTAVTLTAKYRTSDAGSAGWTNRFMAVTPIRVS